MKNDLLVKLVVFSLAGADLQVFLPKKTLPSKSLKSDQPLDLVAKDIFTSCFSISPSYCYLEQLYTFSTVRKGKREVAVVYYVLLADYKIPENTVNDWYSFKKIKTDFSEKQVIQYALQRLRWKIEYTNIVYSLLPEKFIFSDLQAAYEAILGETLDKRNFRKKILSLNILAPTGKMKNLGRARPAEVFTFKKRQLAYVEIL